MLTYNGGIINVESITLDYLLKNGYEGLFNDDCGCSIDDTAPCGDCPLTCKPGYKLLTPGGECDFVIVPEQDDTDVK